MRRWLALLFIALLPLRGWVGDAMAGEMMQMHLSGGSAPAAALHDCPGHDDASAPADAASHGVSHGTPAGHAGGGTMPEDCATCASCQACSAVALALPVIDLGGESLAASPPLFRGTPSASAEPARDLRPPIA